MDRPMLFGKYCLLERISVGGMAEVFRAKPLPAHDSGKMLALKRILPHLAEDEEFITMFEDEATLTVQLKHPNIVETYELGNFQSSYYILMEFIAGADVLALQKRLRQRRKIMSVAQACYVAQNVGRGLDYAHQATDEQGRPFNIIHRDVSPQNIRLTFDGRVKLIDFGIAKAAVQRTKTQVGVLKGKFGYMSPEQVRGESIDHRSDIFALGICLWEMLTNRRLFNGENEFETLQMVKHPDIPPPSEKNSQVPPEVDDIVMKALTADVDERYQSAGEMAEELGQFLDGINQPYTQKHLAQWMADTFSEELAEERHKRSQWRGIETASDVKEFAARLKEEEDADPIPTEGKEGEEADAVADVEGADEGKPEGDDDQVWDPDFAPEDEDVDHEEFASNHTRVAAGGFDPSQFEGDQDDDIISLADDDIVEVEDEGEFGEAELEGDVDEPFDDDSDAQPAPDIEPGGRPDFGQGAQSGAQPAAQSGQQPAAQSGPQPAAQSGSQPAARPGGGAGQQPGASGRQRAQVDSSGTDPGFQAATPDEAAGDEDGVSTMRIVYAAAAVLAMVGMAGAIGYTTLWSGGDGGGGEQTATVVINATPNPGRAGEVRIDDEQKGTSTPLTVSELGVGPHLVEVRYPGYSTAAKRVELKAGDFKTVELELERDPDAKARVTLEMPDGIDDTDVFVDGDPVEEDDREDELALEPGKHLVEVLTDDHRPWSRVLHVTGGETRVEQVEMRPKTLSLKIEGGDGRTIRVNGDDEGTTRAEVGGLAPDELHDVELVDGGRAIWESALGFPTIAQGVLELSGDRRPASRDEDDFGWFAAQTGEDWWGVLIDGVPTGLHTPIEESAKIPVEPGEHQVTFRRANQMHEEDIEIEAGETTSLDKSLDFDWSKPEL